MNKILVPLMVIALVLGIGIGYLIPHQNKAWPVGADGDTNFTNLVTSGDITVGDDLTVTGDLALSGEAQLQRVVQGGTVTDASSTLYIAKTLTAAQVCDSPVITVNTSAATTNVLGAGGVGIPASIDVTFPATSTLFADCLDTNGDSISLIFVNASPTAATTTELIAGTGCEAMISGDTGAADHIAGGSSAKVTLQRMTDYLGVNGTADCELIIEELVAD